MTVPAPRDDFQERAIPAIPRPRHAPISDDYDTARISVPRQQTDDDN